jgi:2',3'-cyclic-nucleotide 2'-phosphodiesterase (5'-nucleotidase family)
VLSTNDTHGHLLPSNRSVLHGRRVGGSAVVAAYFEHAAGSTDCPAFRFSAGDVMQGTPISNLFDGRSTIAVFNRMGYDAAAIGNHEFDWGVDTLRARIRQADFPFLGANIYIRGTDRHPPWARPWIVVERGGVRIGVVGVTTRSTPETTMPANVEGLDFRSLSASIDRYVPEVRARGVDFVVVLLHAGGFCHEHGTESCRGEAIDALRATRSSWDYAVTGHTHSLIRTRVRGRPVVQSWANGTAVGEGHLTRVGPDSVAAELPGVRTTWSDSVTPDPAVARLVERYRTRVAGRSRRPVATLAEPLRKRGSDSEYGLGDLIADAQRDATGTQVAIMNNGGIRRSLPAGRVTYGDLFEVEPFGNALVRLRLTGRTLRRTLEHALEADGPHAHVSGIRVCYEPGAPRGRRIRSMVLDGGALVRPDSTYSVTVNDFMAGGGAGFSMLEAATTSTRTGIIDLDALVRYLSAERGPVRAPTPDRWTRADGSAASRCIAAGGASP